MDRSYVARNMTTDKVIMCRMRKNSRCTADIVSAGQCPCVLVPRPLPHSPLPSQSPLPSVLRFSLSSSTLHLVASAACLLRTMNPLVGVVSQEHLHSPMSLISPLNLSLLYKTRPKRPVDVNQMLHAGVTDLDGVREEADYRVALRLILE